MKLFEYFDKTYCINLIHRADKLELFHNDVIRHDLGEYVRFDAINGSTINQPFNISKGNVGLIMSNIKILEECVKNNYKNVLIIEDDCYFTDEITNVLDNINLVPDDWDMLYFGGNHNTHVGVTPPAKVNDLIVKLHHTYTTHMVAIKSHLFETIISLLGTYKEPIDVLYTELQKRYNVYCFYPGIAKQRKGYSDIQNRVDDNNLIIT
jgi:GR25 family glycosyltransferase involved in LPS biosynthesis